MSADDRQDAETQPPTRTLTPSPSPRRGLDGEKLHSLGPNDHVGVWVVDKALGKGGMASVYKCHNRHAPRIEAAIKLLDPALSHEGNARARFVREAEILFALDHAHIVRVSSVNLDNVPPFLEMEYVRGKSIEEELAIRGALPVRQALELTAQVASALAYLHRRGVYHRDIKPLNLLLQPNGRVKLVDFGLAVEAAGDRITLHGSTFGTPSYAPPEWGEPVELDPVSWDLYALGVVLYEMLTGEVAFPVSQDAESRRVVTQVMLAKQRIDALDPGAGYPPVLRNLVRSLTARDPSLRPRSAHGVRAEIRRILENASEADEGDDVDQLWAALEAESPGQPMERVASRADAGANTVVTTARPVTPLPTRPRTYGPPRGRRALVLLTIAALGALAVVLVARLFPGEPEPVLPEARRVSVVVSGVPDGEPVALTLRGAVPTGRRGFTWSFRDAAIGEAEVAWAVGGGCFPDDCPGDACPAWCASGRSVVEIPHGEGIHTVPLTLAVPPPRDLEITLAGLPSHAPVSLDLDAVTIPVDGNEILVDGVAPGVHTLTATVGRCAPEHVGCADTPQSCPPGCASWREEWVVGVGEGTVEVTAAVRGWTAPAPPPEPAPVAEARGPVTRAQFAEWIAANPDWHRDAAIGAGLADAQYLSGWTDGVPLGPADAAMVHVSWFAAEAFCRGRGGLRPLDAEPLTWSSGGGEPSIEWRIDTGGTPSWRREDGVVSHAGPWTTTNSQTGFRCGP